MKNRKKTVTRYAIFYKSHGEYIGPYRGDTFSKRRVSEMKRDGELNFLSNYVLRSPLQLRRRRKTVAV